MLTITLPGCHLRGLIHQNDWDRDRMNPRHRPHIDPRRVAFFVFAGAMVAAPFLALLYGRTWGLTVLLFGLLATTFLAVDAYRAIDDASLRGRLRILAAVNALLAFAVLGVLLAIR